jgi:DNA-binding IclR family transcriptional regulator
MATPRSGDQKQIKTTKTVFDILEYVLEQGECGVTEVASGLEMSKSTVHAHLVTLERLGYLVKEGDEYRLGLQFLTLGGQAQQAGRYRKLYNVAKPEIDDLASTTDERAQLVVEEGGRGFYLYQARGSRAVIADSFIGSVAPLHTTAAGKSILSGYPDERVASIVEERGLDGGTEDSIADLDTLVDELESIRERGVAFDRGERVAGIRCVAAPVETDDGEVLGAVSVSVPKKRARDEFFDEELPELVRNAARVIALNAVYS